MRPAPCIAIVSLAIAFIAAAPGCRSNPGTPEAPRLPSISGTIALEGADTVAENAILAVRLVDLGRTDAARVVVEQLVSRPGTFPYRFRLYYNRPAINLEHDYGIEALVTQSGRAVWVQAQPAPVLTRGRPQVVNLLLRPAH